MKRRLRSRPRGIYEPTTLHNILETNPPDDGRIHDKSTALLLERGKAFRSSGRHSFRFDVKSNLILRFVVNNLSWAYKSNHRSDCSKVKAEKVRVTQHTRKRPSSM